VPEISTPEDDWQAFNLGHDDGIALLDALAALAGRAASAHAATGRQRVQANASRRWASPVSSRAIRRCAARVLAPITAHYSWSKG
jgi:hypothetical protein